MTSYPRYGSTPAPRPAPQPAPSPPAQPTPPAAQRDVSLDGGTHSVEDYDVPASSVRRILLPSGDAQRDSLRQLVREEVQAALRRGDL